jgi:multimeric flavodoxin WrbA
MYKAKPYAPSPMPAAHKLRVLALNASLKHAPEVSNTEEVVREVIAHMGTSCEIDAEIVRLSDLVLPVGLGFRESNDDHWPAVVEQIKAADVVIFATPIWWGGRSSLMQRVIERLDALDEEYIASGRSALYNKVAGVCITGSEDGALHTLGTIMMVLTWMGFTLPPECACYWVGEVGFPPSEDAAKRRQNPVVPHMAMNMARNLVYYAQLLREHPLMPDTGKSREPAGAAA